MCLCVYFVCIGGGEKCDCSSSEIAAGEKKKVVFDGSITASFVC